MTEKKDNKNKDTKKETEKLKNKIIEIETKTIELENNWKRALADYQNLQKRTAEEKLNFINFANSTLIRKLLPILDNLEMTQKHLDDDGLKMIIKEYYQVLFDEGVAGIETEGKDFDPAVMEAVEMVEGPENKVISIVQKGYLLNGKLLRPARVNVGKGN
jgi:molecular chaperone GrpE